MLYVLVSMLCASCGSSGVPTDPESTSNLLNTQSVSAIAAPDTIIGPGFSGYNVAAAQAPTIAAAREQEQPILIAAADTDLAAPGQPVSSALQALGSMVSTEDPVETQTEVVPVANASEDSSITEDAEIEMAALEADLAALAPDESETSTESDSSDVGNGNETVSNTYSYDSIKANGLGNGTYPTDEHYLAEFLYQNPDVCFWEQDSENKTITSVKTPVPPENSVYMPSPSGGDDTSMLESFFEKNAGKSVVGQGTYKVKTLDIKKPIDIYNMPMQPASGAKQMVRVRAPDVRIFNSPIDGKNMGSLAVGFNVEDEADRFVLVNSGVKDFYHKRSANSTAVFIRGANDFYIVCNRFENIINDTKDKSKTARANSFWLQGRNEHHLSGGLIANNYSSNHQTNDKLSASTFFTIQNYKSVSHENPVRIFANRAHNAGKRFTKNQEGDTLILSNYIQWDTISGPLGRRKLLHVFTIQKSDNVFIQNNRINISAEGRFDAVFSTDASTGSHTAHLGGKVQNNIHFDSNDIELKDNRDPNSNTGPLLMRATASHAGKDSTGYEAKNSSANNNNVHGTGSLRNYFLFRNGYDDHGGRFEHNDNVFSVPAYHSEYLRF